MKKKIRKLFAKKRPSAADETAPGNVPRITTETMATHRDEVLGSARKYIYPLQHSKHRIVLISSGLFLVALIAFFTYSVLALYKFQSSSTFVYRVTQVIPFPVARTGSALVAYENYLFELRHYEHYYLTQQKLDFNSESGRQQLADFKKRALDKVINDGLIKKLAAENNLSVSDKEVNDALTALRVQNRLGNSDKVFEDVLREFWDWSVGDFKRSLKQTLLAQKVVSTLDTETHTQAEATLAKLRGGADFAELAKSDSEDEDTKNNGGDFGLVIDRTTRDVQPQTVEALFKLKTGEVSDIINVGYGLEIVKVLEVNNDKIRAAHILFKFQDINNYLNDLKDRQKVHLYLKLS